MINHILGLLNLNYTFDSRPPDRKVDDTPSETSDLPKSYQNQGLNR